jgi:hypothetical protein
MKKNKRNYHRGLTFNVTIPIYNIEDAIKGLRFKSCLIKEK